MNHCENEEEELIDRVQRRVDNEASGPVRRDLHRFVHSARADSFGRSGNDALNTRRLPSFSPPDIHSIMYISYIAYVSHGFAMFWPLL